MTTYNWDAWQTTFILSLLSNSVADQAVSASSAADAAAQLAKALSSDVDSGISAYLNGDWTVTWGPAVYVDSGQSSPFNATNAAFVAQNSTTNQYVLAIAATDPISTYDWTNEDFNIAPPVSFNRALKTWMGTEGKAEKSGFLTTATVNGVYNVLQNLQDSSGNNLLSYLNSLTASGTAPNITVTGHSLAGALSPVLAVALTQGLLTTAFPANNVTVFPTAGATPGDKAFASFYSNILQPIQGSGASASNSPWQVWNVDLWNQFDIVPSAWQVGTINLIPGYYAQAKGYNGTPEYSALTIAGLYGLATIAETQTAIFDLETQSTVCRLAPAFVSGTGTAAQAWTAWPGCLNGLATATDSFGWQLPAANLAGTSNPPIAWGQIPEDEQKYATALTVKQQIGFQHVATYETLILGSVIFGLQSSNS